MRELCPPFDGSLLLRHAKRLKREAGQDSASTMTRILMLSGWTTQETAVLLELMLLSMGIRPDVYHTEYGRYYEEAVVDTARLESQKPQIVYVHTSTVNIQNWPQLNAKQSDVDQALQMELARFESIWDSVSAKSPCTIIQNNFDAPIDPMGNLGASAHGGRTHFVNLLNVAISERARNRPRRDVVIHDINSIASTLGRAQWFDAQRWYAYKLQITPDANATLAYSLARLIAAILGRSKKCLVLDLDNTLWGGVIGDDGVEKIRLGRDTAEGEAYISFQEYCLALQQRGVLLAVCSKNEEAAAKLGFDHPDSVLKLEHFSSFRANWATKVENISSIANQLNIGLDSLVFVDDNPAERELVRAQLPMVQVPDVGSDVGSYIDILSAGHYFETTGLSVEDLARSRSYQSNAGREGMRAEFASYDEYLEALEMRAEVAAFSPLYIERISQLVNKTNQFNLTTRRYTPVEIERIAADPQMIALYGRLFDRFGDNGLISVVVGRLIGDVVEIELWLMSCRVLKRGMELAMLDELAARAAQRGARELRGSYLPTAKNAMVAELYAEIGFTRIDSEPTGQTRWSLALDPTLQRRNKHISISGAHHD